MFFIKKKYLKKYWLVSLTSKVLRLEACVKNHTEEQMENDDSDYNYLIGLLSEDEDQDDVDVRILGGNTSSQEESEGSSARENRKFGNDKSDADFQEQQRKILKMKRLPLEQIVLSNNENKKVRYVEQENDKSDETQALERKLDFQSMNNKFDVDPILGLKLVFYDFKNECDCSID